MKKPWVLGGGEGGLNECQAGTQVQCQSQLSSKLLYSTLLYSTLLHAYLHYATPLYSTLLQLLSTLPNFTLFYFF